MTGLDQMEKRINEFVVSQTKSRMENIAKTFVREAVKNRLGNHYAHNITGNLLNSIVAIVCENGTPYKAIYANKEMNLKPAIRKKLSATQRGNKKKFYISPDYDGANSTFKAEIQTDGGFGIDDAIRKYNSVKAPSSEMFTIILAYTVEYADWIEAERQTAGYLETLAFADDFTLAMLLNQPLTPSFDFIND